MRDETKNEVIKKYSKGIIIILLLFITVVGRSQSPKIVSISILADKASAESQNLLKQLQTEVNSVVGHDATIIFKEVLENDFSISKAESNYQKLLNDDTDIILAFGPINNLLITNQQLHKKPTILFGALNKDIIDIDEAKQSTGINNFTYLITSQSYKEDLQSFKNLYDFKNLAVLVEDYIPYLDLIKEKLDKEIGELGASYKLILYSTITDIKKNLDDVDAVYMAGGFLLSDSVIKELADFFIARNLPSFTVTHMDDVMNGIMATNQAKENMNLFFRRIALNIEAIVNGTNPSELPIYIDSHNNLTVNYNTALEIGVDIKYSLITTTDFVGDFKILSSKRTYTLLDVINQTLNKNLSLQFEKKNIELKQQDVKIAKSNYYPNISASTTSSYLDPKIAELSAGQNPEYKTSGNITLNQTIFSEASNANIAIKKILEKAQQETYNASELDAILNASYAYFNTLILKNNLQIQAQNLEVTRKNLQIAKQNYSAGQSGKTDLLRFRSEQAQNIQVLVEAGNQLKTSLLALNQILNNDIDFEIDVEDAELYEGIFDNYSYQQIEYMLDNPSLRDDFVNYLVEESKKQAPEIKSIDYNLEATKRNLKLNTYGRFMPTLGLQGQYNRDFNQWGKGSTPEPAYKDNYNVGLNLSIPIFQQNQQNINKQTAIIQLDQLNISKENRQLSVEINVRDAVLAMISQMAIIQLSKVSEETAKESLDLTQASYSNGAVTITELIDAQRNYLQAQLSKVNASYNYLLSSIQLERYLGQYFLLQNEADNRIFFQRFNESLSNRN